MQTAVIVLGAGSSQTPFLEYLSGSQHSAIAIDRNKNAPGIKYADQVIQLSTYEADPLIRELDMLAKKYEFRGLIARTSGPAIPTAATIAQRYDLRGITEEFAHISTRKSVLREFCSAEGIPFPEGRIWDGEGKSPLPYPVIIKPDFPLVGKRDIKVIRQDHDFQSAAQNCAMSSFDERVEIEQYLSGPDVSIAVVMDHGLVYPFTDWDELVGVHINGKIKGLGVHCPSILHGSPIRNSFDQILQKIADKFFKVQALVIFSFRIVEDTPYLIEIHSDLGGDKIAEIVFSRSYPKFDFFRFFSNFYCSGVTADLDNLEIPCPTGLINEGDQVIQDGSRKKNLWTMMNIIDRSELSDAPHHLDWYLKQANAEAS